MLSIRRRDVPSGASGRAQLAAAAVALITGLLAVAVACGGDGDRQMPTALELCGATEDAESINVASSEVKEASGLAASRSDRDILWLHNDSGDTARVLAINRGGHLLAAYTLDGAKAIDWEDMETGPAPDGKFYLYMADIGDNAAEHDDIVIYRAIEPEVAPSNTPTIHDLVDVQQMRLRYPDRPHDAETLLVDPISGDIVIVTKDLVGPALVFRAPGSFDATDAVTLVRAGEIDFALLGSALEIPNDAPALPKAVPNLPTAGDVSADGSLIAIRTYGAVWVWQRDLSQQLTSALREAPCQATSAIEPQGEAISIDADGRGYTTVSEGENPPLHHFSIR